MAGKTKKQGGRVVTPRTPKAVDMPNPSHLGHLGLKSSPYAPTDCKLVSQHMVRDRMAAHYKKLNKTKAAVDTGPPKAYLVSQKMRDRARREAAKNEAKSSGWRPQSGGAMSLNDLDKSHMYAMMENLSHYDDLDDYEAGITDRPNTSMELHASQSSLNRHGRDMQLVNRIVDDSEMSPSRYTTNQPYRSNIPPTVRHSRTRSPYMSTRVLAQKPLYKTQTYTTSAASPDQQYMDAHPRTPRASDVIDKHKDKFTEGKPFQPRTLKSNRTSKLSQFKYYNPPKRLDDEQENNVGTGVIRPESGMSGKVSLRASMRSRPGTADSVDLMDETIVSRDFNDRPTPTEVPSLDITMDQDNINWLKEQSHKAKLRGSARSDGPGTKTHGRDTMKGTMGMNNTSMNSTYNRTANGTMNGTLEPTLAEEEELQYLQFIQDVTSDVLDRGIFTNRMLKQIFESHVIKRRHLLNEDKMRDKLEDLRIELGIPEEDESGGTGLNSTLSNSRASRRSRHSSQLMGTATINKKTLPNLHSRPDHLNSPQSRDMRTPSPDGKPPLPQYTGAKGSRTLLDTTTSSLGKSHDLSSTTKEEEGDSVFGTVTRTNSTAMTADILKVDHDAEDPEDTLRPDINGNDGDDEHDDEEAQTLLYKKQLASIDRSESDDEELHGGTLKTETDRAGYTERTEDQSYTERTGGQTNRTETEGGYTERTESRSPAYSDRSDYSQNFDSHRSLDQSQPSSPGAAHDDYEEEKSSLNQTKPKVSPRRRRREANNDSARSHDRTNTTASESVEVSELDEDSDNF